MTQTCKFGFQFRIGSILLRTSLSAANSVTALSTMLLNSLILLSIWKTPSLRKPSHILIANLALADFLVGAIGQPVIVLKDVLIMVKRNEWFDALCTSALVGRALTYWLGSVSTCTLTVISIDRLLAIKLKASYPNTVTLKKVSSVLLFWWVVGGILFVYFFFFSNIKLKTLLILLSIAISCALSIITLSYYKAVKLMKNLIRKTLPTYTDSTNFDLSKYQKSLKTMVIVLGTIMVFYIPYFIAVLFIATSSTEDYEKNALKYNLAACAEVILLANSTLNPLIYLWRMKDLREAAKISLKKLFGRKRIRVEQS